MLMVQMMMMMIFNYVYDDDGLAIMMITFLDIFQPLSSTRSMKGCLKRASKQVMMPNSPNSVWKVTTFMMIMRMRMMVMIMTVIIITIIINIMLKKVNKPPTEE